MGRKKGKSSLQGLKESKVDFVHLLAECVMISGPAGSPNSAKKGKIKFTTL